MHLFVEDIAHSRKRLVLALEAILWSLCGESNYRLFNSNERKVTEVEESIHLGVASGCSLRSWQAGELEVN